MRKRYTLPAVTREGQDAHVEVLIDAVKLREWLSIIKRNVSVDHFRFHWFAYPHPAVFHYCGQLAAAYKPEGIYVKVNLCLSDSYSDVEYPIDKFWNILLKGRRPPSIGLCMTVKV